MKKRANHPGLRPPDASASRSPVWVREKYLPTLHELAWLACPEGRAVCEEMAAGNPAETPSAIARWRERLDAELVIAAWTQVTIRASARAKFSRADEMLFDRVGLEQSTDETVAAHKARRFAGSSSIADLCCGIGGDTIALARLAPVSAVDISGPRATMAEHNASVYGGRATGIIGDVGLTHPAADAAHLDPDRRPAGRREHDFERGSPDLPTIDAAVRRYHHAAVKLSPGADFTRLPFQAEIELISHHGNCKQAVAWTGRFRTALRRATVLPGPTWGHVADRSSNRQAAGSSSLGDTPSDDAPAGHTIFAMNRDELVWPPPRPPGPGLYLLEPDPAVIRANLVGVLAGQLDCQPIDPHIAWLVSDRPVKTPLARTFRVIDTTAFNEKKLRPWLGGYDIGSLDIKTRATAFHPDDLVRRLRLSGSRHATLLIARLTGGPVAILATREPAENM